jgi:hypothetical protein
MILEKFKQQEPEKKLIKILNPGPTVRNYELKIKGVDFSRYKLIDSASRTYLGHVMCWNGFRNQGKDCHWTFTIPKLESMSISEFVLEKGGKLGVIS